MNYLARVTTCLFAVCALFFAGSADAARKAKEVLQYIPADTPYVIAFTKPMPDGVVDKYEAAADKSLSAYRRVVEYMLSEAMVDLAAEEDGAEKAEQAQAMTDEILSLMSIEGLRGAGFGRDALGAIYGDGLLPVIRLALSDGEQFDAAIKRLEANSPEKLPTAEVKGQEYRYIDLEEMRLVIATRDDDAVITVVPATLSEDRLAQTLGLSKPQKSLAKTNDFRNIRKEYGYTDHFLGFIDVERIAATFMGDPSGLNAELLEILELSSMGLPAECEQDVVSLAGVAPRIVMGYTEVNKNFLDSGVVIEVRDDIAAGLATLPAAVPGLGPDLGGLMTFGFSLDPLALRSFYESRLDVAEADPYECEAMAAVQAASAAQGRTFLAQPLPPVVYSFRGFLANITNIEGMDVATQTPPESIDASLLFAIENAQDLVTMAAMMSPEIAALNLIPDGKAKALNLPQLAEIAEQAFAALSQNGLSISMGAGAEAEAESMLNADVAAKSPFMSMSFDAKRYYDFIGQAAMEDDQSEDGEQMPLAMRAAIRDAMVSSGEMYERMAVNVHLTKRGIEIDSRLTLAD